MTAARHDYLRQVSAESVAVEIYFGLKMPLVRVLFFAALALQLLSETASNNVDIDLWHQMALARQIAATGAVPKIDPFAYTPTIQPVVHHEWGAGIIVYSLAESFGAPGILLLKYLLMAAIFAAVMFCAVRRGGDIERWGFTAMPAVLLIAGGCLPVRAQMYSYLFVALLLLFLQYDEEGRRSWIAPWLAAFPIWENLHGGCALGIVLVVVGACERIVRRRPFGHLFIVAAAMGALLVLNPYGTAYYGYLWRALTMARPEITEWQPVWTLPPLVVIAFCVCAGLLLYAGVVTRFVSTPGIALLLCVAIEAVLHAKLVPLFGLVWLCYVPGYLVQTPLGARMTGFSRNWTALAAGFCLLLILLCVSGFAAPDRTWPLRIPGDRDQRAVATIYPVAAVEFLKARHFQGNLMTPFSLGAYVSWNLYPAVRVSLDSRFEAAYPPDLLHESLWFYAARPGWQATLAKYPTDAVLVPAAAPLANLMPHSGWSKAYYDRYFQLYFRPGLAVVPTGRSGRLPDGAIP